MTIMPPVFPHVPINQPVVPFRGDRDPSAREDAPRFGDVLGAMLGGLATGVSPDDDSAPTRPMRTVAEIFNENGFFHRVQGEPAEPGPEVGATGAGVDAGRSPTSLGHSAMPSADVAAAEPAIQVDAARLPGSPAVERKAAPHLAPPPAAASPVDANETAGIADGSAPAAKPFRGSIGTLLRRLSFGAAPRPHGRHPDCPIGPGGRHRADFDGDAGIELRAPAPRPSGPKTLPKNAEQPDAQLSLQQTSQGMGIVARLDRSAPGDRARLRDRIAAVLARHGYAIDFIRLAVPGSAAPDHRQEG